MMHKLFLIFALLQDLHYLHDVRAQPYTVGEHSIRFPDQALDQRLCLSFVTGFDWIAQQLSTNMDKYLRFYNTPEAYGKKRERSKRRKAFDEGKPSSEKLATDVKFKLRKFADYGTVKYEAAGEETRDIVLNYPVEFKADEFSGIIDFGMRLKITKDSLAEKNLWKLELDYANKATITNFNCSSTLNCDSVKAYLEG